MHLTFILKGYARGSAIEASVFAVDDREKTLAAGRSVAGSDGNANLDLTAAAPPAGAKQLKWRWTRTQGTNSVTEEGSVSLESPAVAPKKNAQGRQPDGQSVQ